MRISDQTYDLLKFIAINIIPSIETLWLTISKVWGLPYGVEIGVPIGAIGVCLAGCIGLSKAAYEKAKREEYEGIDNDE